MILTVCALEWGSDGSNTKGMSDKEREKKKKKEIRGFQNHADR